MNILFVCTGNTCRSPMAEGMLKAMAEDAKKDVVTLSAGLFTAPGGRVSPQAIEAVKDVADISGHLSRPLNKVSFGCGLIWLSVWQRIIKKVLLRQFPEMSDKIVTLGEWAGTNEDVADPFGGTQEEYDACAAQIKELLTKALAKLD